MKGKIIIAASTLLLSMTSATLAQTFYAEPYGYGGYGYSVVPYGIYDYAPGYGYAYGGRDPYYESYRGGPGPRVGSGQGMGAGSQR
jgi:hypothetical protein